MADIIDTVHVVRVLNQHFIEKNPSLLDTQGIMRVAGAYSEREKTLNAIKKNESLDAIPLALLTDAYKHYLQIKPDTIVDIFKRLPNFHHFQDELVNRAFSDEYYAAQFTQVLADLVTANDTDMNHLAEIIHSYFHLATKIAEHSANNSMNATNMGVILGPFLNVLFDMKFNQAAQMQQKLTQLKSISTKILTSGQFQNSFATDYPEKNIELRQDQIQRLQNAIANKENDFENIKQQQQNVQQKITAIGTHLELFKETIKTPEKRSRKESQEVERIYGELLTEVTQGTDALNKYEKTIAAQASEIATMQEFLTSLKNSCEELVNKPASKRRKSLKFSGDALQPAATDAPKPRTFINKARAKTKKKK